MDEAKAAELIKLMVARHVVLELDMVAEGRGLTRQTAGAGRKTRQCRRPQPGLLPLGGRQKCLGNYTEFDDRSPADRALLKAGFAAYRKFIARFVKAGGKVLTGDDTSGPDGRHAASECSASWN